ncbi:acyl-CoA synthetase [Catenovulum sp. 2E275]|uniref:ApeI family dehydratase n=1 Tax=Catenovulum sp. 2E275 TaxID=2980497 RepID=UPI0021D038F3|nr:acyl-CoA synthetase [Catenovulum sp. 2E275]MCU4676658.1 acyl-CoA synthetase [Catenovulum sp. 2E275]
MSEFVYQPEVNLLEHNAESLTLELFVPANLYYFQGHFELAPVLPGVVQTEWVMQFLAKYFQQDLTQFSAFSNLKFQLIVAPNYQLTLEIKQKSDKQFLFKYLSDKGQHASGKVIFK